MKKKTDAELFRELRIITIIIGTAMIIVAVVTHFMESLGEYWYRMVLIAIGLLLISFSCQKYFQEHPKILAYVIGALILTSLLGVVVLLVR